MIFPNIEYQKATSRMRKIARIWSLVIFTIAAIILIAEIFDAWMNPELVNSYPWYENLLPITMFLAVIGLAFAWRWELIGSVLCIICLAADYLMYIAFGGSGRGLYVVPLISLPILIPGILFLISWLRTERVADQGLT